MGKIFRRIILIACALFILPAAACGNNDDGRGGGRENKIWTAGGTVKILRNKKYDDFDRIFRIKAFKNEYEAGQIIITAGKDIENYDIRLNDLKSGDGETLSKEYFKVFNEKYITVSQIRDVNSFDGAGDYPDALLPFETAVKYHENKVKKDNNQGIWITLKVPEDQKSGEYSGSFTLTADETSYDIPAEITIYDYALSGETHVKSSFSMFPEEIAYGELDYTSGMYDRYYDFMLDHRIDPEQFAMPILNRADLGDEARLGTFLKYAESATLDERCSHYNIPYRTAGTHVRLDNGKSVASVDFEQFGRTLRKMAGFSAEKGINLFKKAGTYFIFFDEYNVKGMEADAVYNLDTAYALQEQIAEELKGRLTEEYNCDAGLEKEILADLAGLRHKIVGSKTNTFPDDTKGVFVPTIDKYNLESGRKIYDEFSKRSGEYAECWTYTCCNPYSPYPTYHIEDVLLSSRLLGWMMYNYNIAGNLYWDTSLYAYRKKGDWNNYQLFDYYGTALRYPLANGDGFLTYPGRPYGIYGPVDTVRLQSIRDGNEDWDLLYALENFYKERNIPGDNFDSILGLITKKLYSGTRVKIDGRLCDEFAESRGELASLLELAANTGFLLKSYEIRNGAAVFECTGPEDVKLYCGGREVTGTKNGGYKDYTITAALDSPENYLDLKVNFQSKDYSLHLYLGGRLVVHNGRELDGKFNMTTGGETSADCIQGKECLKAVILPSQENDRISVDIDFREYGAGKDYDYMILEIYSDRDVAGEIRAKGSKSHIIKSAVPMSLKKGWNRFSVTATMLGINNDLIEILRFNFNGSEPLVIGISEITLEGR